ncbi:MAG: hypothetical protein Q9188_005065 [Gyalolechia gomerana]
MLASPSLRSLQVADVGTTAFAVICVVCLWRSIGPGRKKEMAKMTRWRHMRREMGKKVLATVCHEAQPEAYGWCRCGLGRVLLVESGPGLRDGGTEAEEGNVVQPQRKAWQAKTTRLQIQQRP